MKRLPLLLLATMVTFLGLAATALPAQGVPCRPDQSLAVGPCDPAATGTPKPTPPPSAKPSAKPSSEPSAESSASASPSAPAGGVNPDAAGGQPDTAAGEWAKESSKSASQVNDLIGKASIPGKISAGWLPVYAICFGLGMVLMTIMLMVSVGQAAGGPSVNGFAMLKQAGTKAVLFIPVFTLLPGLVYLLQQMFSQMGDQFFKSASASFASAQTEIATSFEGVTLGAIALTNPILLILLGLGIVVFGLVLAIELTIANYSLYIFTCLLPLVAAMTLNERFKGLAVKLICAMFGVMLVKPVVWLAMWIGWDVVYKEAQKSDPLGSMMMYLLVIFVSCSVPLLTATILPRLLPGERGGDPDGVRHHAGRAIGQMDRTVQRGRHGLERRRFKSGGAQGSSTGPAAQKATAQAAKASTNAGGASAAGGAAGASTASAAGGPIAAGVAAGVGAAKSAKDGVSQKVEDGVKGPTPSGSPEASSAEVKGGAAQAAGTVGGVVDTTRGGGAEPTSSGPGASATPSGQTAGGGARGGGRTGYERPTDGSAASAGIGGEATSAKANPATSEERIPGTGGSRSKSGDAGTVGPSGSGASTQETLPSTPEQSAPIAGGATARPWPNPTTPEQPAAGAETAPSTPRTMPKSDARPEGTGGEQWYSSGKGRSGQEGSLMPTPPNPAPAQPVQEPTSKPKSPTGDNGVDAARREVKESEKR